MQHTTVLQIEATNTAALLHEVGKLLDSKLATIATPPPPENGQFITRQQVAELYGVTLPTVHSWMKAGILKPYKIGNKTRFLLGEVKAAAVCVGRQKGGCNE